MELWPHQQRGIKEVLAAIAAGQRRILLTSPTGGGKTAVMAGLIRDYLTRDSRVVLYTNRKLLVDQTSRVLEAAGVTHGVRAAGHLSERWQDVQVASIQTEAARCLRTTRWQLHEADLVLVDEAHVQKEKTAQTILEKHHAAGASIVGLTATPIGLAGLYDHLIVAGTNSELRECGALVPCHHYGPDEPDLRHIGKVELGADLSEPQIVKAMMVPGIFGRVWEHWQRLNPEQKPTLLFAPGVKESVWFAEQFHKKGVSSAHVDGESIWWNGVAHRSSRDLRDEVLNASRTGALAVICNRFVLREGVDAPWLEHGILATVFGSLQSYLQSGGRLLRAHPGCDHVVLQDHGGNWHRHGSLNADRTWDLTHTPVMITGLRQERLRQKQDREPARCPECSRILSGLRCPCGYTIEPGTKSRPVIQANGELQEMHGDIFKPRRLTMNPNAAKIWERMYHRAKKARMTFRQAEALFAMENHWKWPPHSLPLMPTDPYDWFRKVKDVPREELT